MKDDNKKLFKDLKEHPVKILALVYPYILIVGVGIGTFYLTRLDNIARNNIPPAVSDTAYEFHDLKLKMPSSTPMADVMQLSKPSDSLVAMGKALFGSACASCHGADGKGNGAAASSLNPKPRNFTSKTEKWVNGPSLSGIFTTLSEGIKGSAMVAFDTYTPEQRFALAQYIRQQFVPNPPAPDEDALKDLSNKFHLSEAQKSPGEIPVKDAMILVSRDVQPRYQKIMEALRTISTDNKDNGAVIFNNVTNNKIRALTMLSSTDEWKGNENTFIALVVNEMNIAGFNDKVNNLTGDEWDTFYNYMNKVL